MDLYKDTSILESVLTRTQPLGPIDQARISDVFAHSLLDDEVEPFKDVGGDPGDPYTLLLGRKGSGKSAILTELRLKLRSGSRIWEAPERLPKRGQPYILAVLSWEHFLHITQNVARQSQILGMSEELKEMIPSEYYESLWRDGFWDEIIRHFYNYSNIDRGTRHALDPVNDYMNAETSFVGPADTEAKRLFDAARRSILAFLEQRKSRLYFLFDSIDNYPVRSELFSQLLVGLFQALISIDAEPRIQVSFCIPEELEGFLNSKSANVLKDFASSYRIRWRPVDLLRIVAHRFRLATKLHDEELYADITELDFSRRDHIHQLFSRILPDTMQNNLGYPEDPLAYIIRHTQLLPRHVIAIFNAILSRSYSPTTKFRHVDESAIRDGVSHVQEMIATQILFPYNPLYPKLMAACGDILPDLSPICPYGALKKVERRFNKIIEDDVGDVWETLFRMGMLGRIVEPVRGESVSVGRSDRYRYADFHFNGDGGWGMATEAEYCFHPVFSRRYQMSRPQGDMRVVYPANTDLVTLT